MRRGWCWMAALAFASSGFAAEPAGELAARILKAVGRPVGLAHLPRCGDGALALALAAADPGVRVHGQDADYGRVLAARREADARGLFGRRACFDQGTLGRLLVAGRSADLVALTDLAADDLTPALAAEVRRVLHPWFGVAVVGDASGRLDAAALRKWAASISPTVAPLPGAGTLVLVKAEAVPGADDWAQWWHGADNNAVSKDTAFSLPATVQWAGRPYFAPTRLELPIVAGGRLFMLWNGLEMDMGAGIPAIAGAQGDGPMLMAQAVGSGARLWLRHLSPAAWVQASRAILVADGDSLLAADGNRILELDAATGAEKRHAQLDTPEIKWMALHQGRLFVLGGPATKNFGQRSEKAVIPFRSSGLHLMAVDRKTFSPLWRIDRQAGQEAFDPRSPALSGDRLFLCTENGRAEAYTTSDGKPLWKVPLGFERMKIQEYEWDRSSRHPVTGYAELGVYVISGTEMREAIVVSQADGKRLWTSPTPGPSQLIPIAFRDLVWKDNSGVDAVSGKQVAKIERLLRESCSRPTMAPFAEFTAYAPPEPLKSSCMAGTLVADGLLWKFPSPCVACTEWRGFIPQAAREDPPKPPERLARAAEAPAPSGPEPQGWLAYRGNDARSLSCAATIPEKAAFRWVAPAAHPPGLVSHHTRVLMDAEFVPTPPVVAGNCVIVANADGSVDALGLADGKPLWRAYTSGRVHSSPAIWRDRALVPSEDGYLYAFALADGRELWRLRVAPEAGRIMVYEQLGSRWPLLGSPLVADGKVVASAGMVGMVDGVHAVCADAASGRILWERSDWTAAEEGGHISGGAQFALGDALFYHGGMAPPIRIDPADGACQPAFAPTAGTRLGAWNVRKWRTFQAFQQVWSSVKGQDVGVLSPAWLVYGGRRILTDQAEDGAWRATLKILGRDAKGLGRLPVVDVQDCTELPAWDGRDVVFLCAWHGNPRFFGLAAVPREKLLAALDTLMPKTTTAEILAMDDRKPENSVTVPASLLSVSLMAHAEGLACWRSAIPYGAQPVAMALAGNAVLVATALPHWKDPAQDKPGKLTAVSRADGAKMWELDLPARVVRGGLAVAADGAILLTFMDGRTACVGEGK